MAEPAVFDWTRRLRRVREAAYRIVDGEAVVVLSTRAEIKVLNDVGARIWDLFDGTATVDEIARRIGEEFEGAGGELRDDVREFVDELVARGMLEPVSSSGA